MKHKVIVPSAGESINEVYIGAWLKKTGDFVKKDEVLVDLETQKATFDLQAENSGRIEILFPNPDTVVKPGDVIAMIDDSVTSEMASTPVKQENHLGNNHQNSSALSNEKPLSPAVRKVVAEKNLNPSTLQGSGKEGRILKEDVLNVQSQTVAASPEATRSATPETSYAVDESRGERREPVTRLRRQIAQNLVSAQHTAAILTTFNEVDMTQVIDLRKKQKEHFKEKYGVAPGIVSFFALAAVRALKEYPMVNAFFTGDEVIHRDFIDLSIAVSTDNGLVVPVIRDADKLHLIDIEKKLVELTEKAKTRKLSIPEMTGGTFTISNGGVFGSLLSTPILNMPQSAILGLHKTQERVMVVDGKMEIRPMMYVALSYDHRLIDGREAVLFLVKIKEGIENLYLILDGKEFY